MTGSPLEGILYIQSMAMAALKGGCVNGSQAHYSMGEREWQWGDGVLPRIAPILGAASAGSFSLYETTGSRAYSQRKRHQTESATNCTNESHTRLPWPSLRRTFSSQGALLWKYHLQSTTSGQPSASLNPPDTHRKHGGWRRWKSQGLGDSRDGCTLSANSGTFVPKTIDKTEKVVYNVVAGMRGLPYVALKSGSSGEHCGIVGSGACFFFSTRDQIGMDSPRQAFGWERASARN